MPTPYDREKNDRNSNGRAKNGRDQNDAFALPDQISDEAIWDLLSVYADGEATPAEAARVERLLHAQPSLVQELNFLRRTTAAARTVAEVEPPLHLRNAILDATVRRPTLARRAEMALQRWQTLFAPRPARFALAGGLCAAGLVALLLWPNSSQFVSRTHTATDRAPALALNTPRIAPETHAKPADAAPVAQPLHRAGVSPVKPVPQPRMLAQNGVPHAPASPAQDGGKIDRRAIALALNVDRTIVSHLLTANVAVSASHGRTSAVAARPQPAIRVKLQKPVNIEHVASNETAGQFSPVPRMDLANQRGLTAATARSSDDTLGANIDDSHDTAPVSASPAAVSAPDNGGRHIIHVSLSQLPPDARPYLTTADLKRQIDARNLGLSRLALNRIEQKRCDVPLYSGKF